MANGGRGGRIQLFFSLSFKWETDYRLFLLLFYPRAATATVWIQELKHTRTQILTGV